MNTSMVERHLQQAAGRVVAGLRRTADGAFYLFPDEPNKVSSYVGYSYTIPKEEQVRSEFYRHLDSQEGLCFELEWNVYERAGIGTRMRISRSGEIDLVGFHDRRIVAALEVKRIWMLEGWNNKPSELLRGIETDLEKLKGVTSVLSRHQADHAPLAGVIVASFADSLDRMKQLRRGLKERFPNSVTLHEDVTSHVCAETEPNETNPSRTVFLCTDFVRVED